ncbi:MAG: hypothetical protein C4522_17825 [Desulfobacteraceae bacterium]|nr:MAG: hypothetical protein C4522_17825 [Desulfobacteraceae bacterium]
MAEKRIGSDLRMLPGRVLPKKCCILNKIVLPIARLKKYSLDITRKLWQKVYERPLPDLAPHVLKPKQPQQTSLRRLENPEIDFLSPCFSCNRWIKNRLVSLFNAGKNCNDETTL